MRRSTDVPIDKAFVMVPMSGVVSLRWTLIDPLGILTRISTPLGEI
jgi:hypothetical protein